MHQNKMVNRLINECSAKMRLAEESFCELSNSICSTVNDRGSNIRGCACSGIDGGTAAATGVLVDELEFEI